mmetsp:Transcript_3830/g.7512  ORF Transcript_3830/g.7512 Transcript_3830/m.7512 type:complete len:105 (-) Transcript_3830:709-1023(-)
MIREFSAIILRYTSQCTEPRGYQLEDIFNLNFFYFRCAFLVFFQKRTSGSDAIFAYFRKLKVPKKINNVIFHLRQAAVTVDDFHQRKQHPDFVRQQPAERLTNF